jgi:hypothetical protein
MNSNAQQCHEQQKSLYLCFLFEMSQSIYSVMILPKKENIKKIYCNLYISNVQRAGNSEKRGGQTKDRTRPGKYASLGYCNL